MVAVCGIDHLVVIMVAAIVISIHQASWWNLYSQTRLNLVYFKSWKKSAGGDNVGLGSII